jgi:hypothetical protein
MKLRTSLATLLLASTTFLAAQHPPQPAAQQAPGAAPNKVWVNTTSNVYHCPNDRYYGKTKEGKYMTEPEAKAAGAHGPKGQVCFK